MRYRPLLVIALVIGACPAPNAPDAGMSMVTDAGVQCTQAMPCALASGMSEQGTIATAGQINYYSITVPSSLARPIVQVSVTRPSVISAVDLLYTLETEGADASSVIGTRQAPPTTGAVNLSGSFSVSGAGTYLLTVRDANNHAEDPNHPYTVTATVIEDPNTGAANGTPTTATALTYGTPVSGYVAAAGEEDFYSFQLTQPGLLQLVLAQGATGGPLQLEMQVLLLSSTDPDNLVNDSPVAQYQASAPGVGIDVNAVRLFAAGSYVIEISDVTGMNAKATANSQFTLTVTTATNPDPQNQNGMSNATAATATQVAASGISSYMGVIGYDGEHEWFEVPLPASTPGNIVQVTINPETSTQDVQLIWAVGTPLAQPSGMCDPNCGPTAFCVNEVCAYNLVAYHQFMPNETNPQVVRIRQQGDAQSVYVYLAAEGDTSRTTKPYQVSFTIFPDPDPNEPTIANDTIPTATPISMSEDEDGGLHYSASGMDSWWYYIDGVTTANEPEDLDWYKLPLPPLKPEPCTLIEHDGGSPDAGDAGSADAFMPGVVEIDGGYFYDDGGSLCPVLEDGGPAFISAPDYGMVMRWHGPADETYKLGLQGVVNVPHDDGGQACVFSFDESIAQPDGDGGYVLGADAGDPCFCMSSVNAAQGEFWVRIDAPHRPIPPAENMYSDEPYSWELELVPNHLLPMCGDAGCPAITRTSTCPGD